MTRPLLIDASNLVTGGAVQVAASLIEELARMHSATGRVTPEVLVSEPVLRNVTDSGSMQLTPAPRRWRLTPRLARYFRRQEAVLTLFGPVYGPRVASLEVMGYADVTTVYDPATRGLESHTAYARRRVRRSLSRASVMRADHVITETEEFRRALVQDVGVPLGRVSVIPNTYHRVFDALPRSVPPLRTGDPIRLLYVSRAYPHKNHPFLGALGVSLASLGAPRFRFMVTLSPDEWSRLDADTREHCDNVGPVDVADLPSLYGKADGVIFPSLLEAFSATPLEAARAGKPLFAADRGYVRTVIGDSATYIDPLDADSAARIIHDVWRRPSELMTLAEKALKLSLDWPTGADRAQAYMDLMDRLLDGGDLTPGEDVVR